MLCNPDLLKFASLTPGPPTFKHISKPNFQLLVNMSAMP